MTKPNKQNSPHSANFIRLCASYLVFYVVFGVTVKYFLGSAGLGYPGMSETPFLIYSTIGGTVPCLLLIFFGRWYRFRSSASLNVLGLIKIPRELCYLVPSGLCVGLIIPTTTLLYSLPTSVMVAMILLRGGVILITRLVDEIQIRQGYLNKSVDRNENIAVVLALVAIVVVVFSVKREEGFLFFNHPIAIASLLLNIFAYGLRLYIMSYYKNSLPKNAPLDLKGFFAIEQITAALSLALGGVVLLYLTPSAVERSAHVIAFRQAILNPHRLWGWAMFSGINMALIAFLSFKILMYRDRTATFVGLVTRLVSLIAGTLATLLFFLMFNGKPPSTTDWISFSFMLAAIYFLARAESHRSA